MLLRPLLPFSVTTLQYVCTLNLFQEDELRRPIDEGQVLGNDDNIDEEVEEEDDDDGPPELRPLYAAAMERGLEKRLYYMDHIIPQ